ncbi:MAG: acyl-CoA dehydratase activase-related protein, partial [Sphaerochaetaceae bacterium]
ISALMGAYGAALHAQRHVKEQSTIATAADLHQFTHTVKLATCHLCSNSCRLTVNTFNTGVRYISGNRCERPITKKSTSTELNIYQWKLDEIRSLDLFAKESVPEDTIAMPLGMNTYELIYFWHAFFKTLGKRLVISSFSDRELYLLGQGTIPSDTVCFPAKLLHGHVEQLLHKGAKTIFYPCMTYNLDENLGDNHFNCPVVAYYPEVLKANMEQLEQITYLAPHIGLHKPKDFPKKMQGILEPVLGKLSLSLLRKAAKNGYEAHAAYEKRLKEQGQRIIDAARIEGKKIMVLAGRPYHIDPEISHGVDTLLASFGVAIISEDVISGEVGYLPTGVLNQWTYHSRLYAAAKAVIDQNDMHLIQLVSFGCGVDAITSDETRDILEAGSKMYTQIKIDEIANLGAVRIRLRSLLSAIEQQELFNGT